MRAAWWWVDRWRKSSAYTDLTLAEQGAYRNLLDELWLRDGVLPKDDRTLGNICGDAREWPKLRERVLSRFTETPEGYRNDTHDAVQDESKKRATRQQRYRNKKRNVTHDVAPSPSPSPSPSPTTTQTETAKVDSASRIDLTPLEAAVQVFDYWRKQTKRHAKWTKSRRGFIEARLREEDGTLLEKVEALKLAVDGAVFDPWFNGTESGRSYLDFDNIFRNKGRDRIEKLQRYGRTARAGAWTGPPARPAKEDPLPPEDGDAKQKWEEVKAAMSGIAPPHLYRTWFSPTFGHGWLAVGSEKPALVVRVPSEEHRKTLRDVYGVQIKTLLEARDVKLLQLAVKELQ